MVAVGVRLAGSQGITRFGANGEQLLASFLCWHCAAGGVGRQGGPCDGLRRRPCCPL